MKRYNLELKYGKFRSEDFLEFGSQNNCVYYSGNKEFLKKIKSIYPSNFKPYKTYFEILLANLHNCTLEEFEERFIVVLDEENIQDTVQGHYGATLIPKQLIERDILIGFKVRKQSGRCCFNDIEPDPNVIKALLEKEAQEMFELELLLDKLSI